MPTLNRLTDAIVRRAEAPEKPVKLFDGHGLFLFVTPAGGKLWRMAYRLAGKAQTATLGPYPLVSLADARKKRDDIRRGLLEGKTPTRKVKASVTLREASDAYWASRKDVTEGYRNNALRGIEMHLGPALGDTPVNRITRDDLMTELNRMDAAGLSVYVRRVRLWSSHVFDWAVEQHHCAANPAATINPKKAFSHKPVKHHAALPLSEIPVFMRRLAMERDLNSVLACRLLALTWVRTGELRMMQWGEITGDLWTIPAGKMKRKKDHLVPLSAPALAIIEQMRARSRGSDYVFPSEHRLDRPMSENTILEVIARIGYEHRMSGHGWRTVGSTWANEHQYPADAIERQLAHTPENKIRSAYNRAEFLPIRRKMLEDFAHWLLQNPAVTQG